MLDGCHRQAALKECEEEGIKIPELLTANFIKGAVPQSKMPRNRMKRLETAKKFVFVKRFSRQKKLIKKIIEWYHQAKDLTTILFGVNLQSDYKFYREFSPISCLSLVLGPFSCIKKEGNDLKYDEEQSIEL